MGLIEEFIARARKNEISEVRIAKYQTMANSMLKLCGDIEATLKDMARLELLVSKLNSSHYSAYTKSDFKTFIKQLWKFQNGKDPEDKPHEIRWIKSTLDNKQKKLPKGLLNDSEIKRMLTVAKVPRDRAIIMLLFECGFRISELCALKKSDVVFIEQGVRICVPEGTKTGSRSILAINSAPFLATYLASHPTKENDGFVFLGQHWITQGGKKRRIYSQIGAPGIAKMLRLLAKEAGITRRIYPHLFRHSAATTLAKFLSEQELKVYMGWTPGSNMASVYVHLSGKDVDDALLRMHGQLAPKAQEDKLAPIFCERCNRKNANDATRCDKCGLPFDKEAAKRSEIAVQEKIEKMQERIVNLEKLITIKGDMNKRVREKMKKQ